MRRKWKQWQTLFSWAPKSLQLVTAAKKKMLVPWKKSYDKPNESESENYPVLADSLWKQGHDFADESLHSQNYGFSSSHVWMWELAHKESWAPKKWYFWTVVLEMTLESSLNYKEIKPVNPKGNQLWVFIEGLMLKLKLQYFGHLMWRDDSLEKTLMMRKIDCRRRRGQQRMRCLDGIIDPMDINLSKL